MFNIQQLYALPHCIYVFCIYLRTNSNLCHLTINWLAFITEMKSVNSAVRTGSLNKAVCHSSNSTSVQGNCIYRRNLLNFFGTYNCLAHFCCLLVQHIILNLETLTPWKTVSFEKLKFAEPSNLFVFKTYFWNFHFWTTSWTTRKYLTCWQCILWRSTFNITIL